MGQRPSRVSPSGLAPGTPAEAEATQVAALRELLDRGYGRATQPLAGDDNTAPLAIDFRWADAPPAQSAPEPEPISDVGDTVEDGGVAFAGNIGEC